MSAITESDNETLCGIVYYWTLTKQHMFWADNTASKKKTVKREQEVKNKAQDNKNFKRNGAQRQTGVLT